MDRHVAERLQITITMLRDRIAELEAQIKAIQGVEDGSIRIDDTKSILLHSPTYCAFCGKMFPDTEDSTDAIRAHVQECQKHPLAKRIVELEAENAKLEQWADDAQSGLYINCVYCGHHFDRLDI